jgi:hypothetical protein
VDPFPNSPVDCIHKTIFNAFFQVIEDEEVAEGEGGGGEGEFEGGGMPAGIELPEVLRISPSLRLYLYYMYAVRQSLHE